ncbi:MAG: ABC transporter permease, partial [Roseburia sp.]|nr:ABC transporter permease [Roseburia sp.]
MEFLVNLGNYVASDLRMATPILLAALGLLLMNLCGLMNIGCEGIMLTGTIFAVIGSYYFQNVWIGFLFALLSGMIM